MPRTASTPVVHLELHTGDLSGARELYADLCGWRSVVATTVGGELAFWQPKR